MNLGYRQKTIALFILLLSTTLLPVGCTTNPENYSSENGNKPAPETDTTQAQLQQLNIAVIPDKSPEKAQEQIAYLADYLQETLGLPVNIQLTKNYDNSIDLIVTGQVEMAYLGPFSYVKAKERNPNLEPIVAHIEKSTGRPWYTSVIVVNTESGIDGIKDLKGKRFSFVSESSTSGYLFPLAYFEKNGINPEQDFSVINYAGSHDNNAAVLAAGEVDAIAVHKSTYLSAKESGSLPEPKYRMIWESEPIPNSPIVISTQLPEAFKVNLKKALINAPTGVIAIGGANADGYTLVQDEDYEPVRQLQKILDVGDHH